MYFTKSSEIPTTLIVGWVNSQKAHQNLCHPWHNLKATHKKDSFLKVGYSEELSIEGFIP
jgi:hypothetical protein